MDEELEQSKGAGPMLKISQVLEGSVEDVTMSVWRDDSTTKMFALDTSTKRPNYLVNQDNNEDSTIDNITVILSDSANDTSTIVTIDVDRPDGNGFWTILTDPLKYGVTVGLIWVISTHA